MVRDFLFLSETAFLYVALTILELTLYTHSVEQAGLKLRDSPASASRVLELKTCTTDAQWFVIIIIAYNLMFYYTYLLGEAYVCPGAYVGVRGQQKGSWVLYFHYVGSRHQTQVTRFVGKFAFTC